MAMWTVLIKKATAGDQMIEDLGIVIPGSGEVELSTQFTFDEIAGSDDLRTLVTAGTLVVNDGTDDLSTSDGTLYLTVVQRDYLTENHHTKTELAATGGSSDLVDWSQVANAPAFGSPEWITPVECRVLNIVATAPASPNNEDMYVDTDDNHYYKYSVPTTSWVDLGVATTGDRVINLTNATEDIYIFNGTIWEEQAQSSDNTAVMLADDGDSNAAQYIYILASTEWIKIADVDANFGDHFNGGAGKHDASEIDVEGTYTHIATGDLEAAIEDIDDELIAINAAIPTTFNTLDAAYDEGGAGAGRIITTDTGPVQFDRAAATTAPFCIVPKASLPTTGLADGQMATYNGILWIYDLARTAWLSMSRQSLVFGKKGATKDQMLAYGGGSIYSNNAGYRMIRNACITGLAGQLDAAGSCTFQMQKNSASAVIASLALVATTGNQDAAINVDLTAGEYLQCYLTSAAAIQDPVLIIEIAWRA